MNLLPSSIKKKKVMHVKCKRCLKTFDLKKHPVCPFCKIQGMNILVYEKPNQRAEMKPNEYKDDDNISY